jgi:hypothetical protein
MRFVNRLKGKKAETRPLGSLLSTMLNTLLNSRVSAIFSNQKTKSSIYAESKQHRAKSSKLKAERN